MQRHFGNRKSGKWCGSEVDTHELSKQKPKERKHRFYNRNTNSSNNKNNNNNNIYAESSDVNVYKTPKESYDNDNRCVSEDESALDESALKELQEIIESVHIDLPPKQNVKSHEHNQTKLRSSSLSREESENLYEPFKESDNVDKNVLELKRSSSSASLPSHVKNSTDANEFTNAPAATVNDARDSNNNLNTRTTVSNAVDKTNNNKKAKKPRSRQRGKEIELPDMTSSYHQNKKEANNESNSYHNNNKERPYGKYAYKEQDNKEHSRSHSNNKYAHYKKENHEQHSHEYNRDYRKSYIDTHKEEIKKYRSYHHQNDNRYNYNVDNSKRYYYDEYDKHETNKHLKYNYDDRYNDNNDYKNNKNDVDWRGGNRSYYNRYDRKKDNKYNHYDNDNRKKEYHHQYSNDKDAKYKDGRTIEYYSNDKRERRNKYVDSNNAWGIKEKVQELRNMKDMNRASKNTSFTASHELRQEREVHEEEKELTHNVTKSEEEYNTQHYKESNSHTREPMEEQYFKKKDAKREEEEEEEQEIIHKELQEESAHKCKTSEELHQVNNAETCERSHEMIEDKEPITDTTRAKASPLESAQTEEQHSNTDEMEKQTNRQHKIKKHNNNNYAEKPQIRKPYLLCDLCNHIISDCDLILDIDETRNAQIGDSEFDKLSNDQIAQECHNYREHRELYECLTKTRPFRAFVNADVEAISYDKLDNRVPDDHHDDYTTTNLLCSSLSSTTTATEIAGNDLSAANKSSSANCEKEDDDEKEEGEEVNEEEKKKNMALGQFAVALARTADHGPEMFAVIQNACVQINEIIHNSVECRPFIFLFGSCVSMGVWDGLGDADFTAIPQRIIREHSRRDKSKNKKKNESNNRGNMDKDTNIEKKCDNTEINDGENITANNDDYSTRLVENVNTKMENENSQMKGEETAREESLHTHTTINMETEKSEYTNEREKRVEENEKVEEERNNIINRDVNEFTEQCSNNNNNNGNQKESKEEKVLNAIMSKNEESSLLIETARRLRAAGFLFEELEVIHHTRIPLIKRARKLKRAHELKHVGELYYIDVHYDAYYLKNGFRQKTCHRFHDAQFNVGMKLSEESEFHDVVSCRNAISALRLFKTRESPGIQKTWRQHTRLPEIFSIDFDLSCRVFGVRNS